MRSAGGDSAASLSDLGQKSSSLIASVNAKAAQLRLDIVTTQRRIILGQLIHRASFQNTIQESFRSSNSFPAFIFRPYQLQAFIGFAQMTQNTGFLICHINEHPEEFATAIVKCIKRKSIDYVIHCAIPAVFGYFSSKEHLDVAIIFYRKIAELLSEQAALPFFLPLLHSGVTFRFIECAMTRFLEALVIDVNVKENETEYVPIYGHFLCLCIRNSLPLLPQPILDLFKLLRNRKWDPSTLHHLFLVVFLWPAVRRWIRSSPSAGYEIFVERIFGFMVKQRDIVTSICESLFSATSRYELPLVYESFGNQFLDFYISVRDIHLIASMMESVKMMPDTVTMEELQKVPPNREDHCYFCQVYPRLKKPPARARGNSLFQEGTQEGIDKLMEVTLYSQELEKWLSILQDSETCVMAPLIRENATVKGDGTFLEKYKKIMSVFQLPRLARLTYLSLVEMNYVRWLNRDVEVLARLDGQFRQVLSQAEPVPGVPDFQALLAKTSKAKVSVIVDAIRKLLCLDKSSFYDRFRTLICSMGRFMVFQEEEGLPDSVYPILFQQNKSEKFLSTFVVLNNFAMKNPEFLSVCTDEDLTVWLKLEAAILVSLQPNMVLLKTFITIQQNFNILASQSIR